MRTEQQEKILDVSERLFLQKGVTLTSIKDICSAMGISKGTLYYHYASKNEIVEHLAVRYIEKSENTLNQFFSTANNKSFDTMLYECLTTVRLKKTAEKLHYMLMAYGVVAYPPLMDTMRLRYEKWIESINKIVEYYRPGDNNNYILSHVIMAVFDGFAIRNMLNMPSVFEDGELTKEFIKSLNITNTNKY